MTIYTRFGGIVKITGNAGQQQPRYFKFGATLVRIAYDDPEIKNLDPRWYWAEMLKATGGWPEIEKAIRHAEKIELDAKELAKAFLDAR